MRAKTIYLILSGGSSLAFAIYATVSMVYMVKIVGLNPLQLVLVGTVLEATAFLLEVPTGIVADVYSRRLSIIIGLFLTAFGLIITGLFPLFGTLLLAQVIWGAGATFGSGATQAWITDEIGEENVGPVFMRGSQVANFFGLVGIVISVALGSVSLEIPIVLGGVLFMMLAAFLIVYMPETNFTPTLQVERNSFQSMKRTFVDGLKSVRGRTILILLLCTEFIYGMYSEGFDRLWTAHILEYFMLPQIGNFDSIVWFGIISAVGMILSIVATEVARRKINTNNHRFVAQTLVVLYGFIVVSVIVFGLSRSFTLALIALMVANVVRTTAGPLFWAWVNHHVESKVRATVLSMASQINAFGQIGGGPVLGYIGTVFSLRMAIVLTGFVLSPALWIFARTMRHQPASVEAIVGAD